MTYDQAVKQHKATVLRLKAAKVAEALQPIQYGKATALTKTRLRIARLAEKHWQLMFQAGVLEGAI